MMKKIQQAAVLPFRIVNGKIQLLLIQTRSGNKWTIPKGIIDPGYTPRQTAVEEAFEEAGISGQVLDKPYGQFTYEKWQSLCEVTTFIMQVEQIFDQWPEKAWRRRLWISGDHDLRIIKYQSLRDLLLIFFQDTKLHEQLENNN